MHHRTRCSCTTALAMVAATTLAMSASVFATGTSLAKEEPPAVAVLPVEFDEGLTLIQATLADGRPLTLVVDTGASSSVFNQSEMERLGLELGDPPGGVQARAMTASGTVELKFLAEPVQLDLGGAPLEITPAVAIPLDDLARRMGRELHGVLGRQLFQRYVVQVDYAAGSMTLLDPESFHSAGAGSEIGVELEHGSVPAIPAELVLPDGRALAGRFLVDSGARTTLALNGPFVTEHEVLGSVGDSLRVTNHGAAQEFEHQLVRLTELKFAGFRIDRPLARLSEGQHGGAMAAGTFAGVIGAHALARFTVTWDLGSSRMYLLPNASYASPDRLVSAGVSFIPDSEDPSLLRVREVLDGSSAAEQGIRLGDRLVSVGGRRADELTLPEIHRLLRAEGSTVELLLARGGEELRAVVESRDLAPANGRS